MPDTTSNKQSIAVRLATDEDHTAIRTLFYEGLDEGQVRGNDTGADMERIDAAYFADDGYSGFWIAECQNEIVGMVGVQRTSQDAAEIRRLRVAPSMRRKGIGTRLMEEALSFCKHHGYLKVALDVRIDRGPAIALFEKFGFTLGRTRENDDRPTLEFYLDLYRDSDS